MTSKSNRASASLNHPARFARDVRGVVFVEYVVLVVLVALVLTFMLVTLGPRMVAEYSARRGTLYEHSP